ncbi:Twinfilin-1 [Purpureocillium takamizusanense]|uniref:Twinfilin-1 n=1 Tax=Purpureocillium takamizusanense TaxID=2060973 RepID=A0A9Q8Q730_9HYPO|nr:Twinfilin-1 [Purpureocillium takamizusanense]UNI13886.1 Twinfilin-1 [Purpureocillium takamizusanense]
MWKVRILPFSPDRHRIPTGDTVMALKTAILFTFLGVVAQVLAHGNHQTPGFTYLGCFKVDLAAFTNPMVFSDGALTPEACQQACRGYQLAAVFQE